MLLEPRAVPREQIEETLRDEGRGVHGRPTAQQKTEEPQQRQCVRHREPRDLVRDELDPGRIAPGQEQRWFEPEQLVVAGQRAALPLTLRLRIARMAIERARLILE